MSRILIVEPYRSLQYAFAAALCPYHELLIVKAIPETVEAIDLVIVDAAALRERGSLTESHFESIRDWRVPVLWRDAGGLEVPRVDRLKRLTWPLDRETLNQTLVALHPSLDNAARSQATVQGERREPKKPRVKAVKASGGSDEPNRNIVELVDVVEGTDDSNEMEPVKKV